MNNTELAYWLRKNIWDVRAAAALLLGFIPIQEGNGAITVNLPPHRPNDPRSRDWQAELQAICRQANDDIDAGVLPHLDKRKERRVAPAAFARWAIAQGHEVPDHWQTLLLSAQDALQPPQNPPSSAAVTPAQTASAKPVKTPSARKMVAWQAEVFERWTEIGVAFSQPPTAQQVMDWIKKHGRRDVFPAEQPDRYKLRWQAYDGSIDDVQKKTVANTLSKWRRNGMIPG